VYFVHKKVVSVLTVFSCLTPLILHHTIFTDTFIAGTLLEKFGDEHVVNQEVLENTVCISFRIFSTLKTLCVF
jgi:hypothetical protein